MYLAQARRGEHVQGGQRPGGVVGRYEARVEAPGILVQHELERALGLRQRAVAGPRWDELADSLPAHEEVAESVRAAEPLLPRRRIEVAAQRTYVYGHGAESLRTVEQERRIDRGGVDNPAVDPGDVRDGDQSRARANGAGQLVEGHGPDLEAAPRSEERRVGK